jgi:hypothetical protein
MTSGHLAHVYAWALGAGLFLEGAALLLLDQIRVALPGAAVGFATGDVRHNALHVVWGAAILIMLATRRTEGRAAAMLLVFGVLYVWLGVLGLVVERPFGLLLGPGENGFHLVVGPLALALGGWSLWARRIALRPA